MGVRALCCFQFPFSGFFSNQNLFLLPDFSEFFLFRWHHVLVSFSPNQMMSLFVDGILENQPEEHVRVSKCENCFVKKTLLLQPACLDFSVEIMSLVAGGAFPSEVPYLVTTQGKAFSLLSPPACLLFFTNRGGCSFVSPNRLPPIFFRNNRPSTLENYLSHFCPLHSHFCRGFPWIDRTEINPDAGASVELQRNTVDAALLPRQRHLSHPSDHRQTVKYRLVNTPLPLFQATPCRTNFFPPVGTLRL